jgi:hypothetical protein
MEEQEDIRVSAPLASQERGWGEVKFWAIEFMLKVIKANV